jgi:hypothetical protein
VERPGRAAAVAGDVRGAVEMTGIQVPVERFGRADAVAGAVRGAVETAGMPAETEVEIAGGGTAKAVPDETVWAEAEDERTAAARMPIRSVFTGSMSISNRFPSGRKGVDDASFPYTELLTEMEKNGADSVTRY